LVAKIAQSKKKLNGLKIQIFWGFFVTG